MKILIAGNALFDADLNPMPDAQFCMQLLQRDGHDVVIFLKELDVHDIILHGKALREHFPMISTSQAFATESAGLFEGDVVVSADRKDFSKHRRLNVLFDGDWHKVVAEIALVGAGDEPIGKSKRKKRCKRRRVK